MAEEDGLEVETFLQELASPAPVPGGGSAAALSVAMGASLVAMVCELTLGRRKFADVAGEVQTIRSRALDVATRARELVQEDAVAYGAVAAAMQMPRTTDSQKAARSEHVQAALKGAAEPPLHTMQAAREVVDLAERLVSIGNPSAVSDVGTAALLAGAGYVAARLNVEINLEAVRDPGWVEATRADVAAAGDPAARVSAIVRRTEEIIRGEG